MAYAEKMQYRHPPIQEHVVCSHLDFIYLYKTQIEFRSFGGICCGGILTLQKTRFGGPGKPSFWSVLDYGILRFFVGFDEFLQVFDGFSTGEVASSKTWFCWLKPVFSQKLAQNQVLIPRPVFFRDLVDVGYKYNIFISIYRYLTSIQNSDVSGAFAAEAF